jgi:hypothetical protein
VPVANDAKATAYTDKFLAETGLDREYLRTFWELHTPEGRDTAKRGAVGSAPGDLRKTGDSAVARLVCEVQTFVYGDEGDMVLGVSPAAARPWEVDGKLGTGTWRRMEAWLDHVAEDVEEEPTPPGTDAVLYCGERLPVEDVRVVDLTEPGGLDLPKATRERYGKRKGYTAWTQPPHILAQKDGRKYAKLLAVVHWDVCGSSRGCYRALLAQGYGSSMGICNDGTVWLWADPGELRGWHAGNVANRAACVSIDLSNKASMKFAKRYLDKMGIERPVLHLDRYSRLGHGNAMLGMYAAQLETLLRVLEAYGKAIGLPHTWPLKGDGAERGRNLPNLWTDSSYRGVISHRHLPDTTKWDVRGCEIQLEVLMHERPQLADVAPLLARKFRLGTLASERRFELFCQTCRWPELGIGG